MKILQYISVPDITAAGGSERVFCEMANALTARGHEVYAVCNTPQKDRPFYTLDGNVRFVNLDASGQRRTKPLSWKILYHGLRPISKGMWNRYVEDPFNEKQGEPLAKFIQEVQPDVVILYSVIEYFSLLRQPMLDVPVILMHHYNTRELTKHLNTPNRVAKINTCPHIQVLQHSFALEIQKIYHGPIHVIPNVVPQIAEKDLADLTIEKPQKTITMISRLSPKKQQHMLIQAFGRLAKHYPDWKVEIYGSSHKQRHLRRLERMIASLGLADRVKLMGMTNHPLDVLRQSDIFAFPSDFPEGWGLVLTEAMAVGLPCVGLKTTSSVNELIVDGVNGFLTDNTPEDFAEKLKILMDDQNLRAKMGRAGHEMMKQYAPEKVLDQWEELIDKVVRQHRNIG